MEVFVYRGRAAGELVNGQLEADDRLTAVAQLRAKGVVATQIQEQKAKAVTPKKIGKASDKDLAIYTRQFSTMIDAGLPIAQCLGILAEQSNSRPLRASTAGIAKEVEAGATLADAYRKYPRTYDDLFTNLLEAGESGG